jgi:hypothetical protein
MTHDVICVLKVEVKVKVEGGAPLDCINPQELR